MQSAVWVNVKVLVPIEMDDLETLFEFRKFIYVFHDVKINFYILLKSQL